MARTIEEIYNEMAQEKATLTSLNGLEPAGVDNATNFIASLTSGSQMANWRLMMWVCAFGIYVHEKLFDKHLEELEAVKKTMKVGTPLWYRDQALIFQYGDALTWNGNQYLYDPVNTVNQIIKRAAVIEVGGQVRIKVAKLNGSNLPIPLAAAEENSFLNYMQQVKVAGTNIAIINRSADLLRLELKVYYDPLLMSPTGGLISSPSTQPVEDAINAYIEELPFNGKLGLVELTDAIQAAAGVVSPHITLAEAKVGTLPEVSISEYYTAEAGYMSINPNYPLNTTITYVANV